MGASSQVHQPNFYVDFCMSSFYFPPYAKHIFAFYMPFISVVAKMIIGCSCTHYGPELQHTLLSSNFIPRPH
jgi:hypothetical protein